MYGEIGESRAAKESTISLTEKFSY